MDTVLQGYFGASSRPQADVKALLDVNLDVVASSYFRMRPYDLNDVYRWELLGEFARGQARGIRFFTDVGVVDGQPYITATEMFDDMYHNGRLGISSEHLEHPVWDADTNIAFRVWRDMHHYLAKSDFGYDGEMAAFVSQVKAVPEIMQRALFVETIGQLAAGRWLSIIAGELRFAEQKIGRLAIHNNGSLLP